MVPANAEAWDLWALCSTQLRVSMGGIVGLDLPAALQIADLIGLTLSPALIYKLKALEQALLTKQRDDREKKEQTPDAKPPAQNRNRRR